MKLDEKQTAELNRILHELKDAYQTYLRITGKESNQLEEIGFYRVLEYMIIESPYDDLALQESIENYLRYKGDYLERVAAAEKKDVLQRANIFPL